MYDQLSQPGPNIEYVEMRSGARVEWVGMGWDEVSGMGWDNICRVGGMRRAQDIGPGRGGGGGCAAVGGGGAGGAAGTDEAGGGVGVGGDRAENPSSP